MLGGKKGPDGLNVRERAAVKARLAYPSLSYAALAKKAKLKYASDAVATKTLTEIFARPHVQAALSMAVSPVKAGDTAEDVDRNWLRLRAKKIADNKQLPANERLKALEFLARTTPGVLVPVQVDTKTVFTLEKFVEYAGGMPAEHGHAALTPPDEERN